MKKHTHTLVFNRPAKNAVQYTYDFGSTKNIRLWLSKSGFSISADLTNIYRKEQMLSGDTYLFPDAIKKALLLYLLKYSKALPVRTVTVQIDGEEETVLFDNLNPPVYSIINGDLERTLPALFSNDRLFEYLLRTPKSKYDRRIASLFAFLCSKSKAYETERFLYLWTSLNGMYDWLSEQIAQGNGVDRYRKEYKQIIGFQKFLGIGHETIDEDDKTPVAREIMAILKKTEQERVDKKFFEEPEIREKIEAFLVRSKGGRYQLTAYGYLLTQLSYYFRCKIVHGSKPVFLFTYADDQELHCLKIINALLEEYIDENLPLWFDEEYISNHIIPKAHAIELK